MTARGIKSASASTQLAFLALCEADSDKVIGIVNIGFAGIWVGDGAQLLLDGVTNHERLLYMLWALNLSSAPVSASNS
jgi:hypothetical protein